MQWRQGGDDLLQEVEVDGSEAASVDIRFRLAYAQVHGFVGTDVEKWAGILGCQLGEFLLDEIDGAGLSW